MTDTTNTGENDLATKRITRRTAAAFVASAIGAAILVIAAWAVAVPHLRIAVIEHTETAETATAWLRASEFARFISVLVLAIAFGVVGSRAVAPQCQIRRSSQTGALPK